MLSHGATEVPKENVAPSLALNILSVDLTYRELDYKHVHRPSLKPIDLS